MAWTLPALPYALDALEPHIDARTMDIHHSKHHQTYVTNLNNALEASPQHADVPIEQLLRDVDVLPQSIRTAVRNNGGGHANHTLFWQSLDPKGGGEPTGTLGDALNSTFGSFAHAKEALTKAALARFGSGWAWLMLNKHGALEVTSTPNQDSPYMDGHVPLFGIDVWEHAYYLHYQNRRADYVHAVFEIVNWSFVQSRFDHARS